MGLDEDDHAVLLLENAGFRSSQSNSSSDASRMDSVAAAERRMRAQSLCIGGVTRPPRMPPVLELGCDDEVAAMVANRSATRWSRLAGL